MTSNPSADRLLRRAGILGGATAVAGIALTAAVIAGVDHSAAATKSGTTTTTTTPATATTTTPSATTPSATSPASSSTNGIGATAQSSAPAGGSNGS